MQIPLFPLHTVLAPGIALPLHVFEERYRAMVRHCLDASAPFGIVLIREGSEVAPRDGAPQELAIAAVGTFAEIREASRYADGRWDVLVVGTSRFAVRDVRVDLEPYLVADVEPYPDEPGDAGREDLEALVDRVTRRFVDYLRLLQPREGETAEPIDVQMEVETDEDLDEDAAHDPARDPGDVSARDPGEGPAREVPLVEREVPLVEREAEPLPVHDPEAARVALRIPEDPSALSYLLTGIIQVEPERRQELLEAAGPAARLRELDALLDRELQFLGARLAPFAVDRRVLAGSEN